MRKLLLTSLTVLSFSGNALATQIYKCQVNDKKVYQNTPCAESFDYGLKNHETFDGWRYGMNIIAIKKQAALRKLPVSPGPNSFLTKYNEQVINSKIHARIYPYNSIVAGKNTKVALFFTAKTQRLYEVKAQLFMSQLPVEEKKYFYASLVKQLSKKYGSYVEARNYPRNANFLAKHVLKNMVGTEKLWGANTDNLVSLTGDARGAS
jgi:hypothetical protein